jgi:hypothetical protein
VGIHARWRPPAQGLVGDSATEPVLFFEHDVQPGESIETVVCVRAPAAGRWTLELGLLQRTTGGDVWFADADASGGSIEARASRLGIPADVRTRLWAWPLRALRLAWRDATGTGCA